MIRSILFGASGLKSNQIKIDVVGNNISNTNTVGFKAGRAVFTEVLSQTLNSASMATDSRGGVNPVQLGLGTSVGSIDKMFSDSQLMATGKSTDLALEGNALFVVSRENETYYTRDGAFSFDGNGNYVLPASGLSVKGWNAVDGIVDPSAPLQNITSPIGRMIPPKASGIISYYDNLDVRSPTISQMVMNDSLGGTISVTATTPFTVGSTVNANISNVGVTFSNGVTLPSTSSGYTNGSLYGFSGMTATLSNGASLNLSTANGSVTYSPGHTIMAPVVSMTVVTSVGTITPTNGTMMFSTSAPAPNPINTLTIVSGPVPNGGNFDYVLSDGSVLTTGSNGYVIGAALDDPFGSGTSTPATVTSIIGSLSDGATFTGGIGGYNLGGNIPFPPTQISGSVTTLGGAILDNFVMTSGSVTPSAVAAPSNITLTTNIGTVTVGPSDTASYTPGSNDTATITKINVTLSDGTTNSFTAPNVSYTLNHSVPMPVNAIIYDSLGRKHSIPIYFEKTATSGQWMASLYTTQIQEADGTVMNLSMPSVPIQFTSTGQIASGQVQGLLSVSYPAGGAQSQTLAVDFSDLTQYAREYTVHSDSDGYTAGTCTGIRIDQSGIITGNYTNGIRCAEAQVAVAQFTNPSGLEDIGNGIYQSTKNTGVAKIETATAVGAKMTSGSLEMSNVNLTAEFSEMITGQRGFQASSKIMTTSDEFLDMLINMK